MAAGRSSPPWIAPIILSVIVGFLIILALRYFLTLTEADATLRRYLTILSFTGALGGIIGRAIADDRLLNLMWFDPTDRAGVKCGIIADGVIGLGGAWGVFLVLGRSMQLGTNTEDLMVLIGLGVVAGFTARTLLQALGEGVEQRVRQTQRQLNQLQQQTEENQAYNRVQAAYTQIENFLDEFDSANDIRKRGMRDRLEELHDLAERAVQLDRITPHESSSSLARVKKRLAMISAGDDRETLLEQAIRLCSDAIQRDPQRDSLYYNRACYRALLAAPPIPAIRDDMRQAIQLLPENKEPFRQEQEHDLDAVRGNAEIAALLA